MNCYAALLALFVAPYATAQHSRPTFADIRVPAGQPSCALGFHGTRSPNNEVLSVLRTAAVDSRKDLLVTGPGVGDKSVAHCTFDIRFERPLATFETLYVDLRGAEFKQRSATIDWRLLIGTQRHSYSYARGRLLDDGQASFKRFAIVVPPGATSLRIAMTGAASSNGSGDAAFVAVDSFDMCFFDPAKPDWCGSASGVAAGSRPK